MSQTEFQRPPGMGAYAAAMVRFHSASCALIDACAEAAVRGLPVTALGVPVQRALQARREFEALETPAAFKGSAPSRTATEPAVPALQEFAP